MTDMHVCKNFLTVNLVYVNIQSAVRQRRGSTGQMLRIVFFSFQIYPLEKKAIKGQPKLPA